MKKSRIYVVFSLQGDISIDYMDEIFTYKVGVCTCGAFLSCTLQVCMLGFLCALLVGFFHCINGIITLGVSAVL